MSLSNKQWEFLQDVAKLINYASEQGYKLTGGELMRTKYQQEEYLRTGMSKTANSNHLRKMAIDLNLFINNEVQWHKCPEWQDLGDYWESLREGNRWGGNYKSFVDTPHFENIR